MLRLLPTYVEIWGIPVDGTFIAACVAAGVGIASLIVTGSTAARTSRDAAQLLTFQKASEQREQFRVRFETALQHALSPQALERLTGMRLLSFLVFDEWASRGIAKPYYRLQSSWRRND